MSGTTSIPSSVDSWSAPAPSPPAIGVKLTVTVQVSRGSSTMPAHPLLATARPPA